VAAAAVAAGAVAAAGPDAVLGATQGAVAAACGAAFSFVGAGNALNDYLDREIDKQGHPDRPIPSGRVRPGAARALSGGLFAVALTLGLYVSVAGFVLVATSALIMIAYEVALKARGLPGNFAIGYLSGITFYFGGLVLAKPWAVVPLFGLAVLATVGRELAKDIEDMGADATRRTFPQAHGATKAAALSAAFTAGAVVLSPWPYFAGTMGLPYLAVIAAADATFMYAALRVRAESGRSQRLSKVAMAVATLAFALGGWLG
jgi:geranylgeranylglycerol-phosphate geranylgeranyltransferase